MNKSVLYHGYTVYPNGTIIGKHGVILKHVSNSRGYKTVSIMKEGKCKTVSVHKIIAECFIPNPENKPQINHINGDKHDNRIENLEWCTISENSIHAYSNGLNDNVKKALSLSKGKLVINLMTGIFYNSAKEASEVSGIDYSKMRKYLINKIKNNTNFVYA